MSYLKKSKSVRKFAFITGASSGIGLATAKLFNKKGWFVGLAARDAEKLRSLQQEFGEENSSIHALDVNDIDAIKKSYHDFSSRSDGKLHALINSAGVLHAGRFEEIALEEHHKVMGTNFTGVSNCIHLAFPLLKNTEKAAVINISSASATFGAPDFASYSASKFAVRALTEALNVEWSRHDIKVIDVMPPFVDTPMLDSKVRATINVISYLGVNLTAEDVAESVWKATNSRRLHTFVGLPYKFIALGQKHSPDWLQRRIVKLVSGY